MASIPKNTVFRSRITYHLFTMKCTLSSLSCRSSSATPLDELRPEQPQPRADTNTQAGHQDRYAGMRAAGSGNARRLSTLPETGRLDLGFLIDAWVKSAPLAKDPENRVKYRQDASSMNRRHKHIDPNRRRIIKEWQEEKSTADASGRVAQIKWESDLRDGRLVKAREIMAYLEKPDARPQPDLSQAMYQSLPAEIRDALKKAGFNATHVRENLPAASEPATSSPVAGGSGPGPRRHGSHTLEIAEVPAPHDEPFSELNSLGLTMAKEEQSSGTAADGLQPSSEMHAAGPSTAYQSDVQETASKEVDDVLEAVPALRVWLGKGDSTDENRKMVVQRIASWHADSINNTLHTKKRPLKLNDLHFKNLPPLPPEVEALECVRVNLSALPELTQLPVALKKINFHHSAIVDIPESYFNERERDLTVIIDGASFDQQLRQRINKHNEALIAADSRGVLFVVMS